ncbi:MAG: hypothetical protein JKY54_17250 [Flavobacteriales bacterium]|nr:hypothetical protein [Flavobacteriales bacterium]
MNVPIEQIEQVKENETIRLAPNLIVWKEGSSYNLDVTNRQFDELENLLKNQNGELFYIVDLSVANRPPPEIVQLLEERLGPIKNKFKHVAVYTGKNYIMLLGIKFYFIRFDFLSYSAHGNVKNALNSFLSHGSQ